jgi:chorismate mutase
MRRTLWLVLALALGGCARPANPPADRGAEREQPSAASAAGGQRTLDALVSLMGERLLVQHEVARSKWHANLPITDPKREQELLDRAETQGRALGLEPAFVREFFRAQMAAGKLVQQADFAAWQRGETPPPAAGPDLKALRLRIDGLNRKLMQALKEASLGPKQERDRRAVQARADALLQGPGITAEVRKAACAPLLGR